MYLFLANTHTYAFYEKRKARPKFLLGGKQWRRLSSTRAPAPASTASAIGRSHLRRASRRRRRFLRRVCTVEASSSSPHPAPAVVSPSPPALPLRLVPNLRLRGTRMSSRVSLDRSPGFKTELGYSLRCYSGCHSSFGLPHLTGRVRERVRRVRISNRLARIL